MTPLLTSVGLRTVLLVDAETENREFLKQELENADFVVLEASDRREAVEMLTSHSVGAVVLDLELSQRQRVALMKEILSPECGNPLVFLLASPSVISREQAYDLGASGAMSKPVNPAYLISRLNSLLTPVDRRWKRESSPERKRHSLVEASVFKQQLGRGGFTLPGLGERELLEGELVEFKVEVNDGDQWMLSGTGVVRFVNLDSKNRRQRALGIEFESLDEPSRKRILANLGAKETPYIPRYVS